MTNSEAIEYLEHLKETEEEQIKRRIANGFKEHKFEERYIDAMNTAIRAIKQEPRKHGKWNVVGHEIMCSECGCHNFEWEFCPHCGADMRGDR